LNVCQLSDFVKYTYQSKGDPTQFSQSQQNYRELGHENGRTGGSSYTIIFKFRLLNKIQTKTIRVSQKFIKVSMSLEVRPIPQSSRRLLLHINFQRHVLFRVSSSNFSENSSLFDKMPSYSDFGISFASAGFRSSGGFAHHRRCRSCCHDSFILMSQTNRDFTPLIPLWLVRSIFISDLLHNYS
jgi:hypothetical protein